MIYGRSRITVESEVCSGRPCIRGMRIRVSDVLDLLADGLSIAQLLDEFPDLTSEDVRTCLAYASQRVGHPMVRGI